MKVRLVRPESAKAATPASALAWTHLSGPRINKHTLLRVIGGAVGLGVVGQVLRPATPALASAIGDPNATVAGNLGVGSNGTPGYKVQIVDDGNIPLAIYESGLNGVVIRGWSIGGTIASPSQTTVGTLLVSLRGGGYSSSGVYTSPSLAQFNAFASESFTSGAQGTYLTFSTTLNGQNVSGERVRIDNAGNVGIGVTAPAALLSVGVGSLFRVTSAGVISQAAGITSSGSIYFTGLTAGSVPFVDAGGLIAQNNAKLFWDNTNLRLGIGAPSTNERLQVQSNEAGATCISLVNNYGTPSTWMIGSVALGGTQGVGPSGGFAIYQGPGGTAHPLVIDTAGRVGIGSVSYPLTAALSLGPGAAIAINTVKIADSVGCYYA